MTTGWISFQLLMEELQRECYIIVTGELELSRPRTQLRVIHINGCLNFTMTQGKVNSPRGTWGGGGGVLGTRDHINWA